MQAILTQIFTEDEADEIYDYLLTKEIEYHKPYTVSYTHLTLPTIYSV